jgi:hypothetical protein
MWRGPWGASLLTASPFKVPLLRALVAGGVLATTITSAAACGAAPAATFHPGGTAPGGPAGSPAPSPSQLARVSADSLIWPPFGRNVHIAMPGWLPADPAEVPVVITAKNFLLAFLYAEYRGNHDHRWTAYVAGNVRRDLSSNLAQPGITTESFTGTIRFSRMNIFADPSLPGALDVSECFDNSHSANTGLRSGKILPDHTPADQHYYRNTDVLARDASGRWHVVSVYPVIYYPQAKECKT